MATPVPVLMYHSISDRSSAAFRRWTVPPTRFAEHMQYLAEAGVATLTAAGYARCLRGDTPLPPKPVLVTFDDGYADFADAALPIMCAHDITSTLFVTSGYVGGTSAWLRREAETDRPMLTWDQLAAMDEDRVELGGHGYSHRQMDTLPLAEALADIARGTSLIEDRTGRTVESFAYPHGYSTPALRRGLAEMGFTSAHGVVDATSSTLDRRFTISRIIVDADTTLARFQSLLAGGVVAAHPTDDAWQQTAWRWWRKGRITLRIDKPHVPA